MSASSPRFTAILALLLIGAGTTITAQESTPAAPPVIAPVDMAAVEQAWQRGDYVFVRQGLKTLAEQEKSALALYRYGRVLLEGLGGPRDTQAGITALEQAVAQNHAAAATLLGRVLLSDHGTRDPERAAALFANAAARGEAEAQYYLGLLYRNGTGVEQDLTTAFNWFLAASEAQNVAAQYELSRAYSRGDGTPGDSGEALRWLRAAAEGGHADAQYFLAFALDTGQGATQSAAEALDWYRRAAETGHVLAQRALGTKYLGGADGHPPNADEAERWLEAAAQAGDPGAMNNLAIAYAKGDVLAQDDTKALRWYEIASDKGLARASRGLAQMYHAGRGVPADLVKAVGLYDLAFRQGDRPAAQRLGRLAVSGELDGIVAPHDAVRWVQVLLTETGDEIAVDWLQKQATAQVRPAQTALGLWYVDRQTNPEEAHELLNAAATAGDVSAQYHLGMLYTTGAAGSLDYVLAHKWLNIAAASGHDAAAATRSTINDLMTPEQIADAQTAARDYFDGATARAPQTPQVVQTTPQDQ